MSTQSTTLADFAREAAVARRPGRRIRCKAPLRLSFCGGGTDVMPYAAEQGGVVLNTTIDRYAYATLRFPQEREIRVQSSTHDIRLHRR